MIQENLTPSGTLDAALRDGIRGKSPLPDNLPDTLATALDTWIGGRATVDGMLALAAALEGNHFPAAAAAALTETADAFWMEAPEESALALDQLARLQRGLGLTWSAAASERAAGRLLGHPSQHDEAPILESAHHFVVDAWNDPQAHARILSAATGSPLFQDPLRDPMATKSQFLQGKQTQDFSFFVCGQDDQPVLQVECDVIGRRWLGCRETAIALTHLLPNAPHRAEAEDLALRQCAAFAQWAGCPDYVIEVDDHGPLSPSSIGFLRRHAHATRSLCGAWIDLDQDEDSIIATYRDNHRRSIRWGMAHLVIEETRSADATLLDHYAALYAATGRRAPLSRDGLAQQFELGQVMAYLARQDGAVVGLSLITRHASTAYYSGGVSAPGTAKPSAPLLMHRAILGAKADGLKRFDFGQIHTGAHWSPKLISIGHFKLGFTPPRSQKLWFVVPV